MADEIDIDSGEERELPAAEETVVELEELVLSPGTYFNPQTEVIVVVDDSTSIDQEIFNMEAYEGVDWVRISEDTAVDEEKRDELLEAFQTHYHPGSGASVSETAVEQGDGEHDEDEEGQDPGRED
jgi:cupin superfamily acireductone dioxygenase involved in methionine salvage